MYRTEQKCKTNMHMSGGNAAICQVYAFATV